MRTINEYLDLLSKYDVLHGGTGSDYSMSKLLKISRQRMSLIRSGDRPLNIKSAGWLGKYLEIEPYIILADVGIERAKTDKEISEWKEVLKEFRSVVASIAIVLFAFTIMLPEPVKASTNVYYVKYDRDILFTHIECKVTNLI